MFLFDITLKGGEACVKENRYLYLSIGCCTGGLEEEVVWCKEGGELMRWVIDLMVSLSLMFTGVAISNMIRLTKVRKFLKEVNPKDAATKEELEKALIQLDTVKHFNYFMF